MLSQVSLAHRPCSGLLVIAALCLVLPGISAAAQQKSPGANPIEKSGKYQVELRVPADGLYAAEETDVEFHISDASQDDPVQGAPPIVNAKVTATVTMPAMRTMPQQRPKTHREGVPGDYGVVLFFPHGGDFQLDLTIGPPNVPAFTVSFKLPVNDAEAAKGRNAKPKPYTLEVTASPIPPRAGEPTNLTILIRSRDTGQPVSDFDIVHEKQIHFMIVSRDLQQFAHEHPSVGRDGRFTLRYTFPTGGEYRLFADVAPKGAGSQILMQPIRVTGPAPASLEVGRLAPSLSDTVNGASVTLLSDPGKLPIGRAVNISFSVKDASTGAPIIDIEPYLGAMAHLMLIHANGETFVHSHPDETDPHNGHNGTLTFLARFPKPGLYRGWLQFQRAGQVHTATFTWTIGSTGKGVT